MLEPDGLPGTKPQPLQPAVHTAATGTGGRAMERLLDQGFLSGLIDIAVKAGGIKVAGVASGIHQKLFDACAPCRKEEAAPLVDAEVVG